MRVTYTSKHETGDTLPFAIHLLEHAMNSAKFKKDVEGKTDWTYTQNTGDAIFLDVTRDCVINVEFFRYPKYTPKYLVYRKTRAYTTYGSSIIHVNSRLWDEATLGYKAGTVAHELCHLATESGTTPARGYWHGDNSRRGKANSVPYWVGKRVSLGSRG